MTIGVVEFGWFCHKSRNYWEITMKKLVTLCAILSGFAVAQLAHAETATTTTKKEAQKKDKKEHKEEHKEEHKDEHHK